MQSDESLLSEPGLILYHRYLFLCENTLCAALLLRLFELALEREYALADLDRGDVRPIIFTHEMMHHELSQLFPPRAMRTAFCFLLDKHYISAQLLSPAEQTRPLKRQRYSVSLNYRQIEQASQPYYAQRQAHLQQERSRESEASRSQPPPPSRKRIIKPEQRYRREAARVQYQLTQAELHGLPATLTLEQWLATLEHFAWKCAYCYGRFTLLEHFVPLALGGGTTQANCVPACHACNSKKGSIHPELLPAEYGMSESVQRIQCYLVACQDE